MAISSDAPSLTAESTSKRSFLINLATMSKEKVYRIKKCRQIFKYISRQYKRRKHVLDLADQQSVEENLEKLRLAVGDRDRSAGTQAGKILETFGKGKLKKTWFESLRDSTQLFPWP